MPPEILFKDVVDIIKIPILIAEPVWQNENIADFEILYTNSEFKSSVADIKEKSMLNSIRTEFWNERSVNYDRQNVCRNFFRKKDRNMVLA